MKTLVNSGNRQQQADSNTVKHLHVSSSSLKTTQHHIAPPTPKEKPPATNSPGWATPQQEVRGAQVATRGDFRRTV
ncbi:MAG: hypothetical protein HY423_15790 [Candidatus Lambdaproteobacteria bacterium]|nr:hypothetical protein [Candidatus Lambdaproteobacteria bacterium]